MSLVSAPETAHVVLGTPGTAPKPRPNSLFRAPLSATGSVRPVSLPVSQLVVAVRTLYSGTLCPESR